MSILSGLVLLLLAFHHSFVDSHASETGSLNRNMMRMNRDMSAGLIPFPRVGRSRMALSPFLGPINYDNSRLLSMGTPDDSEENPWDLLSAFLYQKREGLIPFPRVGRSGTGPKRNGAGTSGSLWFGPRLGKRTYLDTTGDDTIAADNYVPDYFNQNKLALDDVAAVKAGELQ